MADDDDPTGVKRVSKRAAATRTAAGKKSASKTAAAKAKATLPKSPGTNAAVKLAGAPARASLAKEAPRGTERAGARSALVLLKLIDGWEAADAARRVLASHGLMIVQRRHGFALDERNYNGRQLNYGGYGGAFSADLKGGFHRTWGLTKLRARAEAVYTERGSICVQSSPRFGADHRDERGKPFAGLSVHLACGEAPGGTGGGRISKVKASVEALGGVVVEHRDEADLVVVASQKERRQGAGGLVVTLQALLGVLPMMRLASPAASSPDARSLWKLLSARDVASINQGLAVAATMPVAIDALVEGCDVDDAGQLLPSPRFDGTGPALPFLGLALLGLLSLAPDRAAAGTLRRSVKAIDLAVADIPRLAGFSALQSLRLRGTRGKANAATSVTDLSPFGPLPRLRSLQLELEILTALTGLDAPMLKEVTLWRCAALTDLAPLRGLTALASLEVSGCANLTDLAPISGLKALASLNLSWCGALKSVSLSDLPALSSIDLGSCENLTDLSPLSGLPALASLDLSGTASVQGIASDTLEHLKVSSSALDDLAPLAGVPSLTSLDLSGCAGIGAGNLTTLWSLRSLRTVDLSGCGQLPPRLRRFWRVADLRSALGGDAPPSSRGTSVAR